MKEILIIAGPSAVGKTTVASELIKAGGEFELVRSVTTRKMRSDAFGAEYVYLTRSDFDGLIKSGGVLEYTEYSGELYGTPRSEIERIHREGKYPLLILDLEGVRSVLEKGGNCPCAVYLYDGLSVMEKRLAERYLVPGFDSSALDKFNSRIAQNRADYAKIANYSSHFYAFISNQSEICDTARLVYESFLKFKSGISCDSGQIERALSDIEKMLL